MARQLCSVGDHLRILLMAVTQFLQLQPALVLGRLYLTEAGFADLGAEKTLDIKVPNLPKST